MTEDFNAWVGRQEQADDLVTPAMARQMAATLAPVSGTARLDTGDILPPLWHWMAWRPEAAMPDIGPDGHQLRGGLIPSVPLPRRMWAGGRLTWVAPLRIGQPMQRRSDVLKVTEKQGSAGRMVFVTIGHVIAQGGVDCLTEEQDIVFLPMPDRYSPPPATALPGVLDWRESLPIDSVRLFRFSALTFNAHRIHIDRTYAAEVEKYPGLVVHGPLQAILLMAAAAQQAQRLPATFRFRSTHPAFEGADLTLAGTGDGRLFTANTDGTICTQGDVTWAP